MRKLTGRWFLKKKLFGYKIMVECIRTTTCWNDLSESPEFTVIEEARDFDILELEIKTI